VGQALSGQSGLRFTLGGVLLCCLRSGFSFGLECPLRVPRQGMKRVQGGKTKAGHFEPSKFEDQYEDALKELLKKKQEGKPIEISST
jgi:hypothetical protein